MDNSWRLTLLWVSLIGCFINNTEAICTDENFIIKCEIPEELKATSVYYIQLDKQEQDWEEIVTIYFVHPNMTLPKWNNEIQNRSSIEKSTLFPAGQARFVLEVNSLLCSDRGQYMCTIKGLDATGELNLKIQVGTNFTGCPCDDGEVPTTVDGNIESSEPHLTNVPQVINSTQPTTVDGNIESSEPHLTNVPQIINTTHSKQYTDIRSTFTTTGIHTNSLFSSIENSDSGQDALHCNELIFVVIMFVTMAHINV